DINFTADGYLLACNKDTVSLPESKGRYFKVYTWDDDDATPSLLFQTQYQGNWSNGIVGETFAVSGSRWKHTMYIPSVTTGSSKKIRVMGLLYEDEQQLGYKYMIDDAYTEANWGEKFKFTISPTGTDHIFIDGDKILPAEYQFDWAKPDRDPLVLKANFEEKSGYALKPIASGSNYFRNAGGVFMAAPNSDTGGSSVGVVLFDISNGLNNAKKVSAFMPEAGLGTTPAPYMFATGFASGYDLTLIALADKEGAQRFATLASASNANVYASELAAEKTDVGYTLHFTLNDNTQSVKVDVLNGTEVVKTVELGAMNKGVHAVDINLDGISQGVYQWAVTVSSQSVDRPYKFTDNSLPQLQFYSPRGVAIDNSFESPYFGRIYASESAGGNVTNRTTQDGVYVLNAALKDTTNQGANAYHGNVTWGAGSSPMRLAVAPDGKVYVTDWSDSHSGIWVMDPSNPNSDFTTVFGGTRASSGLVSDNGVNIHGSISHAWVTGTGEETKLFTFDEDYTDASATSKGNLLQYNIGDLSSPWNVAPSAVVYNDAVNGNLQQNMNSCIAPDARGGWWISQYRATDAEAIPSLIHVNTLGVVDFNSGKTPTLIGNSFTGGMAVTEDGLRIAMGSNNEAKIFDVTYSTEGIPSLTMKYSIKPAMGQHSAGLAFDKAGNVYVISNSSERLGAWALPKADNTFTTPASSVQTITVTSTNVGDVSLQESISVYPNPVRNFVKVKSEKSDLESLRIYDINGRLLIEEKMEGLETEVNVSNLNSGTYILRIKTGKGVENRRIVKK
ncbi:MAG: T9SS type A sorting domain-containing protein, partial [Paludibacteraceae bacterium]